MPRASACTWHANSMCVQVQHARCPARAYTSNKYARTADMAARTKSVDARFLVQASRLIWISRFRIHNKPTTSSNQVISTASQRGSPASDILRRISLLHDNNVHADLLRRISCVGSPSCMITMSTTPLILSSTPLLFLPSFLPCILLQLPYHVSLARSRKTRKTQPASPAQTKQHVLAPHEPVGLLQAICCGW